ncbi:MAG TPA: 2-C-methyl-D-erythritol 4-phosphate cytidylyltransferase [Steroidobacteraceae bacterium]|jgi:2-C-methyl-D-erythritol 4-phosphate cytidylyltransferase|nr:2-C-methyl-D-erythritol 4-phosphate cytidylyltransferase [Steroidobacteraceae bacterium]
MRYWLVMPAAGAGRRFGSTKQYAPLAGTSVLETALQVFLADARCAGGALVLAQDDPHREGLAARLAPRVRIVAGGVERVHSVRNGLIGLAERAAPADWVLVHDAARPCLSAADLSRLLEQAGAEQSGALLAVPIADTVKRAASAASAAPLESPASAPCIEATVARESLWLAQTPQMFRLGALRTALEAAIDAHRTPTDEAQAMEWQGYSARLVQAYDSNLKITNTADLALAEAILAARREQCG